MKAMARNETKTARNGDSRRGVTDPALFDVHLDEPAIATAIHAGHRIRRDISDHIALSEAERRYEEDPYTDYWTNMAPTRVVGLRSRFEVDLNRTQPDSIYLSPEQAWGLRVWKGTLPETSVARSRAEYDAFYRRMETLLAKMTDEFDVFYVFDIHSYNHRRRGPTAPPADPEKNPEINVGTSNLDRKRWAPVVERFVEDLHDVDYLGHHLDVRENIKFQGGYFPRWIHEQFPKEACALAIEVKKFYMDEWTGVAYEEHLNALRDAFQAVSKDLVDEVKRLGGVPV